VFQDEGRMLTRQRGLDHPIMLLLPRRKDTASTTVSANVYSDSFQHGYVTENWEGDLILPAIAL
jgi:hypothetical protein